MNLKIAIGMLTIAMMAVPGSTVAQDSTDDSTKIATGCLEKNRIANIYLLTDEKGKLWELRSKTLRLGPHVGQTITVTGAIPKGNAAAQNYLLVTKLEMVRDNCKQP